MKRFALITTFLLFTLATIGVFSFGVPVSFGQERSYTYPAIDFTFHINEDSTIDVEEKETFDFHGEYHEGWRTLLLNKVDDITDISVIDAETNAPLQQVSKELDKTNQNNWGKFTIFSKGSEKDVIWYYDAKDTTHTWILHYKLHGAIGFYKDYDELYWNLLTNFSVPIDRISATVILPSATTSDHPFSFYRDNSNSPITKEQINSQTFFFTADNISPHEAVTIAPSWDKGIVSNKAYWDYFFHIYLGLILSSILLFLSLLFVLIRWYILEKLPMQKMTIVPQYEPPEKLSPAMAEIIMKERISDKAWPATIVDLAFRGYLTIEENFIKVLFFKQKEYILKKTTKSISDLDIYEQKYIHALFDGSDEFSTYDTRINYRTKRKLFLAVQEITKELYKDAQLETNAYTLAPKYFPFKRFFYIPVGLSIGFIFSNVVQFRISLTIVFILLALIIILSSIFDPRLNKKGRILKADWLGFKMYIETAERYRLQNLTPDMFERFLPYAMIFGVEKKWAKAFESMHVPSPLWYTGNSGFYVAGTGSTNAGFSPSSFASSFSSTFTSTFSQSGGGGGAGGGAGGGGGGGGGGAS